MYIFRIIERKLVLFDFCVLRKSLTRIEKAYQMFDTGLEPMTSAVGGRRLENSSHRSPSRLRQVKKKE